MAASRVRGGASTLLVLCWLLGAAVGWGGTAAPAWARNVPLTALALSASMSLARSARRRPRGRRIPSALLSAGFGLWALGEAHGAWYDLVLGREVPSPSVADAAFLAFAPVVGCGLLALSRGAHGSGRVARALDGWLVAASCFAVARVLLELDHAYASAGVVELAGVAAYLVCARAARHDTWHDSQAAEDPRPVVGRLCVLMPHLLVLGAACALTAAALVSGRPDPVAIGVLASVVLALIGRQAVTVLDNASLAQLLRLRERSFRSLAQGARDVVVLCGGDLRTTYVSPSSTSRLGIGPEALVGRPFWDLIHPDDRARARDELVRVLSPGGGSEGTPLRCRIVTADGWIDAESSLEDLRGDPDAAGIVITIRDVSERTALEEQLRTLAWQDPLTGLANRTLLRERVERALAQRRHVNQPLGLLLIDLDGFKLVNDTHGHAVGDALLVQVAARLMQGVRRGDTVARLGGDEFAVLLADRGEAGLRKGGLDVAGRLLASLSQPFVIDGREVSVGASMGLTIAAAGTEPDDFVRQADFAMYASKDAGRGRVTVFGPALAAESVRRAELAQSLGNALAHGDLHLEYQPVVDIMTGEVTGAEALARWVHPTWGAVSPAEFVPVAERTGLIVQLGHWALLTAAQEAARWEAAGRTQGVAVNVSVRQLGVEFVAEVAGVLVRTGLTPSRLTLEITESVLVDDERTLSSLQALKALGVRLSLDDFGTGWSSLAYLRRLPVDVLKLDGSFVAGLGTAQADAVSRTVVRLAIDLGLEVVAEGVETVAQRDILQGMGCHSAQGWLYGAAGPADAIFQRPKVPVPVPRQVGSREDEATVRTTI